MTTINLKVDLEPREDKEQQIYYLGKIQFPGRICCRKGVTFLVFLSESGSEELQVAINDKEHTTFSRYSKRPDRLKVSLETREDQFHKVFYIAKIQFHGYIDCASKLVFLVFNSKEGSEELQVVGDIKMFKKDDSSTRRRVVEV